MKLRFGKREKMVIGGISAILSIGILHLLFFQPNAKNYKEAKTKYEATSAQKNQLGVIKNQNDITKYNDQTKVFEDEFQNLYNMIMFGPPKHMNNEFIKSEQEYNDEFVVRMKDLVDFCNASKTTKMTFLDKNGWDIPTKLPEKMEKNPNLVLDVLDKLESNKFLLESLTNESLIIRKQEEYKQLLSEFEIDLDKINNEVLFPKPLPVLKLLMHAEVIRNSLPAENQKPLADLYNLFNIKFYNSTELFFKVKQLILLKDVIEIAENNNISEITTVMLGKEGIQFPLESSDSSTTSTATKTATTTRGGSYGDMMRMRGGGGGGAAARYGRGGGSPQMAASTGAAGAQAQPAGAKVYSTTFMLGFKSTNLEGMKFLYDLTHMERSYEIDRLSIKSVGEGNIEVYCNIAAIFHIDNT